MMFRAPSSCLVALLMDTFFGSDIVVPFSRVPRYRLEAGGSVVCVETVQRLATLCRVCGNSAETGKPVSAAVKH